MFRQGLLRLRQNGIFDHLQTKWMTVPKYKRNLSLKSRVVVGIGQIVLIFYIMVGTIGVVLLILGLELFCHKYDWQKINVVYCFFNN